MDVAICICTHNPRKALFRTVLEAIARQESAHECSVLVVDNASDTPVTLDDCGPVLRDANMKLRIVREPRRGLVHARLRAVCETDNEWLLFVDDDNELSPDYVANAARIVDEDATIGCLGGKHLLPPSLELPEWMRIEVSGRPGFDHFYAVRDCGEERLVEVTSSWGPWMPPGAGAFVHRRVLDVYTRRVSTQADLDTMALERCSRGDDVWMMAGAASIGMSCAYDPTLALVHHIDPKRLSLAECARMVYRTGRANVVLGRLLPRPPSGLRARTARGLASYVIDSLYPARRLSPAYSVCSFAYFAGHAAETLRAARDAVRA